MGAKVYINGRFLTQRVTGIQRYSRETLLQLDAILQESKGALTIEWILIAPKGTVFPELTTIRCVEAGFFASHLWEQFDLPWLTRDGLLMSFCSTGPLIKQNQIITIHDASVYRVPDAFSWKFRAWYKFLLRWIVRRAGLTLTVSHFSAREVCKWYGARPERVQVMTEGWQHLLRYEGDEAILKKNGLSKGRFVLAVSSPTPNKNFELVLKAAGRLTNEGVEFVIAGSADPKVFSAATQNDGVNVKYLGYVSDAELKALYQNAMCFVFPSRYEGFGIPPLEAMGCSCPVLASTIDSVREVCGDAVLYFDPLDDRKLAEHVSDLAKSPDILGAMRRSGNARAGQFSWRLGAQKNLDAILNYLQLKN
jgi:glycosyltransferase involved in cell wall biosynthesis